MGGPMKSEGLKRKLVAILATDVEDRRKTSEFDPKRTSTAVTIASVQNRGIPESRDSRSPVLCHTVDSRTLSMLHDVVPLSAW